MNISDMILLSETSETHCPNCNKTTTIGKIYIQRDEHEKHPPQIGDTLYITVDLVCVFCDTLKKTDKITAKISAFELGVDTGNPKMTLLNSIKRYLKLT